MDGETTNLENTFRTYTDGRLVYEGPSLETAVRTWDAKTYGARCSTAGGITIASRIGDVMVRDGWILHVHEDGTTYLNPGIALTR